MDFRPGRNPEDQSGDQPDSSFSLTERFRHRAVDIDISKRAGDGAIMSHSKHNTLLAFFTNYEREQLKDRWGSQKARLTRESFLPLGACHLCLQPARDPVSCRDGGHIFCRECVVTNLLAQTKEIKRAEKEDARRREEELELERERADEVHAAAVKEFEKASIGGSDINQNSHKRKFHDSRQNETIEERAAIRRKLEEQQNSKASLPFWMPASNEDTIAAREIDSHKKHPTCPSASSKDTHTLSLKSLVSVHFNTPKSTGANSTKPASTAETRQGTGAGTCPSCEKSVSSGLKMILTVPCGHVICKVCVDSFMKPKAATASDSYAVPIHDEQPLLCYVCQTDLTEAKEHKKKKDGKKSKDKSSSRPGLVELCTEGTGFAGGGKAIVDKQGIAFQC